MNLNVFNYFKSKPYEFKNKNETIDLDNIQNNSKRTAHKINDLSSINSKKTVDVKNVDRSLIPATNPTNSLLKEDFSMQELKDEVSTIQDFLKSEKEFNLMKEEKFDLPDVGFAKTLTVMKSEEKFASKNGLNFQASYISGLAHEDVGKLEQETLSQLETCIDISDAEKFKTIFSFLRDKGEHELVGKLAEKLLSQYSFKDIVEGKRSSYEFILTNLKELYPSINHLFSDTKNSYDKNNPIRPMKDGIERQVLAPSGIQLIVDHLKNKGSLSLDCHVHASFSEMKENLKNQIEAFMTNPGEHQCCFLVRQEGSGIYLPSFFNKEGAISIGMWPEGTHITPVYVQKTAEGLFKVIISDSVGLEGAYSTSLAKMINETFKEVFPDSDPAKLYIFKPKRQHSPTNCGIFSIRDVVQFSKHREEIMKWIEEHQTEEIDDEFANYIPVESFPPFMMKTTQSLNTIQQYEKKEKTTVNLNQKHINSNAEGKQSNVKIAQSFLKYERLVIANVIGRGIDS